MGYEEISVSYPAGRKVYDCEWCGEKIPKGEKHLSRTYKFDGDFNSGRMHLECEKAMNKSSHDFVDGGWCFGSNERGEKIDHG